MNTIRKTATILIFVVMLVLSGRDTYAANTEKVSGTARYDYAYQVLDKVNAERKAAGVSELTMDEELLNAAMLRAAETMVKWDHTRPNGQSCFTASSKMLGENIAWGQQTPTQVMTSWMNSAGHKKNILNSSFQSIGVGCIVSSGGIYWVQCFGFAKATAVEKPANAEVVYEVAKDTSSSTTLISSKAVNGDEKKEEASTTEDRKTTEEKNTEKTTEVARDTQADHSVTAISGLKVTTKNRKLIVKWKLVGRVTGYQVQVSTSRSFKKSQSYNVKATKASKTISKYDGKKLKKGKKYYIRVRAYAKEGAITSYGGWNVISKKVK